MGLFSSKKEVSEDLERFERVQRAIADLQAEVKAQAAAFRTLETEWLNTHDKFKMIMGRLQKRVTMENERLPEDAGGPNAEDPASPYAHLDPVSKKIMERRKRT